MDPRNALPDAGPLDWERRVRALVDRYGSFAALARALGGACPRTVSAWEAGLRQPRPDYQERLEALERQPSGRLGGRP